MQQHINDIDIHYRESGEGEKLVLLHGLAEDHQSFSYLQDNLQGVRSYALDLRGHGKSSNGTPQGSLEQLGGDLIGFLETVTGPALCLGYSLGGTIVLWAAAQRPDLVKNAIVVGTSSRVGHLARDFFRDRIEQLKTDRQVFNKALEKDTAAQVVSNNLDIEELANSRIRALGNGDGYVNAATAMMALYENPVTELLDKIQCPVDVIGADGDVFCPRKAADMIVEAIDDAEYHEIKNAGHLISVDQPADYCKTVQEILERRIK